MNRSFKERIHGVFVLLFLCLFACKSKPEFGEWKLQHKIADKLSWTEFSWSQQEWGGKVYDKAAMLIPVKVRGLPYNFSFQFDLGSNLTMLHGNTLSSLLTRHPEFNRKDRQGFDELTLLFDKFEASTKSCYIKKDFGDSLPDQLDEQTIIHLGTVGADLFQEKILVIDYPNRRFAVCDSLPGELKGAFTPISFDPYGRVLLPMKLNGKNYRVMFDNGSSLFPLLTASQKINEFSNAPVTDSMQVSSWGNLKSFTGRTIQQPFVLAGKRFTNTLVYAADDEGSPDYDAIAGNALFWNDRVIIDFRNKQIAIR